MSNEWQKWDHIHPYVIENLVKNNFTQPTQVQTNTLHTYRHYNDFIIASQTGSGKTLAFGIPIISEILYEKEGRIVPNKTNPKPKQNYIRALVIAPTRELAIQIEKHLRILNLQKTLRIGSIVGGISKEKQKRILRQKPEILICTPGRLWDFLNEEQDPYIESNLRHIDYLVIDEADRLVELGHFKDLENILKYIYQKQEKIVNDEEVQQILQEAKVQKKQNKKMSIQERIMQGQIVEVSNEDFEKQFKIVKTDEQKLFSGFQENSKKKSQSQDETDFTEEQEGEEDEEDGQFDEDEGEFDEEDMGQDEEGDEDEEIIDEECLNNMNGYDENEEYKENDEEEDADTKLMDNYLMSIGKRQKPQKKNSKMKVFLVSATLTHQFVGNTHKMTRKDMKQNKDGPYANFSVKIQALLKMIKFSGKPKVIDLTNDSLLPKNLTEYKTQCSENDKYMYLDYYIKQKKNEKFIIFANSISYAKKIFHVLQVLGHNPLQLHSKMQQKQRLRKLDLFIEGQKTILVSTDVAARGLDIPLVQNVVHFQVPKDVDTYIHRSGRTARIGHNGTAYQLVGPLDQNRYVNLCSQLQKDQGIQSQLEIDVIQKQKMREMIEKALSYEQSQHRLDKKQKEKNWFTKNSRNMDIELDDEIKLDMNKITEDISKKRLIVQNEKSNFKTALKSNDSFQKKRPNSLYLTPSQIAEYSQKLKQSQPVKQNKKTQKIQQKQQFKNKKNKQY